VTPPNDLPPDLLRGLTQPRFSRRRFLQFGGLGAAGLALSACSIPGAQQSKLGLQAARQQITEFWAGQKVTGSFDFANWPLYIDVDAKNQNDHPSLDLFTKETGIKVAKYDEVIQDVDSYFGKIQPLLASGQGTGYDLMVMTNSTFLTKLIDLDYLIPLDQTRMTNFYVNASDLVKDPAYDRGNVYTMAWQSGITGVGFNPKYVNKNLTSWQDLQDPAFKGKIGMFGDTTDLPNCALCAIGVNPENSTEDDWHKAAEWLKKQRPLVRKYYQQDYIASLSKGDLWASMAWSGDIFLANSSGANLKFAVPTEGAPIWTDNMCIPAHAKHPLDAMTYMDFVYKPEVAAMIAEYVNYITPVPAAQQVIQADAKAATNADDKAALEAVATSPLVFPEPSEFGRLYRYRVLRTQAEEDTWNNLFEPIFQS
jgi:spermidine/putrescine transport system substrate-binding protein